MHAFAKNSVLKHQWFPLPSTTPVHWRAFDPAIEKELFKKIARDPLGLHHHPSVFVDMLLMGSSLRRLCLPQLSSVVSITIDLILLVSRGSLKWVFACEE
jgi:hypothetical protein